MTFQLLHFSGQFDLLHLILVTVAFIFLLLFLLKKPAKSIANEAPVEKIETIKPQNNDAALQVLAMLQQNGRFIDFLHEDLTHFSDADIGAAARFVHQGSQKILDQYFTFSPVCPQDEESRITLEEDFNAQEIQLTGRVTGQAPFTGTLIHKGWKVDACNLPQLAEGHDSHIIAKAEVEL